MVLSHDDNDGDGDGDGDEEEEEEAAVITRDKRESVSRYHCSALNQKISFVFQVKKEELSTITGD